MTGSTLTTERRLASDRGATATSPYRVTLFLAALTCLAAPAYAFTRWQVGFYPTTLLEVLIVLTVVVFLAESVLTSTGIAWRTPFTYPAALLLVAGLVAVAISPDRRGGIGLYRAYLLEPIAFFFVLGAVVRRVEVALLVTGGLAIGGLAVGLANSAVVLGAIRAHRLNLAVAPPVVVYNTPNAVALYLVPLIAVAATLAVHGRRTALRLGSGAFAIVASISTLLSFSRGGYAALAAVAVLVALSHRRRWWLLGGLAAALVLLIRAPFIGTRLAHELNSTDPNNSLVSRIKLWQATLHMLRDHPVLGTGLSGFARSIGPYRGGVYEEQLIYPHNIILNFWTETGLMGLAAFTWVMIQAIRTALRGWRECLGEWRPLQLGVAIAMGALVVHGLVDVPYWKNDLCLEFWTLLGLSWAGLRWGTIEPTSSSLLRRHQAA